MGESTGRRAASLLLLALALAAAVAYLSAPRRDHGPRAATARKPRPAGFHATSRATDPAGLPSGPCETCHGDAPHRRRPGDRAFLNLHVGRLHCGVCHFEGPGVSLRRPAAEVNRLRPGRGADDAWAPLEWPSAGGVLQARGPGCLECHRPGSAVLSPALYDDYRRRILGDLALLYRLGKVRL